MLDSFVEYELDKGWWLDLFLSIGALVSKYPELSAKRGSLFQDYVTDNFTQIKEQGEQIGKDDKTEA